MHKNIISRFIDQIKQISVGIHIACSMVTASLRSGYTVMMLICIYALLLLYYLDVVSRILFSGGSFISWSLINMLRRRGYIFDASSTHAQWLLHLPEHVLIISALTFMSLTLLHLVKSGIEREPCGFGRAIWRTLSSWSFIFCYSICTSMVLWCVGDINLMAVRVLLENIYDSSFLTSLMHAPFFGKQLLYIPLSVTYWLPDAMRWALALFWAVYTFLLLPVVVIERSSFFSALRRSSSLAMHNIGLTLGALSFYLIMYAGFMASTVYVQAATFPSLEHLGMKGAQVIGIFALMTVLLYALHGAVMLCGQLITGLLIYQACVGTTMENMHTFVVRKSCRSLIWYHLFYIGCFILLRLGAQLLIPGV